MNILNRLTKKNLKLNKKRTIVTIVGIILSVALITALSSLVVSFRKSLIYFEKMLRGNFHYGYLNVPYDDLKYFKNNPNIESYYVTGNIGYAELKESQNKSKPYIFVLGMNDYALKNSGLELVDGKLPKNEGEIVIPNHLRTNGRVKSYNIRDTIKLTIGKRMFDGRELDQNNMYYGSDDFNKDAEVFEPSFEREYKIVGIVERSSYNVEPYIAPGFTFITYLNDSNVSSYNVYTRYTKTGIKNQYKVTANILGIDENLFVKTKGGSEPIDEETFDKLRDELEKAKYEMTTNDYLVSLEYLTNGDNTLNFLYTVAGIVIIIIIVTSVYCIKNSFDISITEKTKQYGMLRSVGATSKQIKRNVLYEAFILGIIGIPIGILSGILAAFILVQVSNHLLGATIQIRLIFSISFISIAISILLSILTIYLSARKSARRASKISPITAIRNSGDIKIKSKKLRTPKLIKNIFGIGGVVSYKNLKRSRKKYRTTIISIIICVSVFIALYSFVNLAFRFIKVEMGEISYNINVNMSLTNDKEKYITEIVELDNIKRYSVNKYYNFYIDESYINEDYKRFANTYKDQAFVSLVSVSDSEYRSYLKKLNLSYNDAKDKGILINNSIINTYENEEQKKIETNMLNVKENDNLKGNIIIYTDKKDDKNDDKKVSQNIDIIKITNIRPLGFENIYMYPIIIVNENFVTGVEINSVDIFIDSSNPDKLQEEIDKLLSTEEYNLNNIAKNAREMNSLYTLIAIFLYGFIAVIALIGITNIFNTITTNMELRSREFATLKSVGMTKKEFNRMIRLESFFYGMKSLLIGLPIGIFLSYLIFKALTSGTLVIKYQLPWGGIIISVLAVFILIFFIMRYSINKINKQNIIETIRNENI